MLFFNTHNRKITIGVLSILIIILFGYIGIALRDEIQQRNAEKYQASMKAAEETYDSGDAEASILAFRELIAKAPSQNSYETVNMRLKLAGSLFARNEGGDRREAVQINKSIILNPEVSLSMRAVAVNDMLDYYNGSQNKTFAREVIFQGDVFGGFLEGEDIKNAMLRAYQYSDSLYPTPIASLRIARYMILNLENTLSEKEKATQYDEIKKRIEQGEELLGKVFTTKNAYKKTKISDMYLLDARNRMALRGLSSDESFEKSNTLMAVLSFRRSLEIIAPEDSPNTYITGLYARFYYAAALAKVFGEKNTDEIKMLLEPIIHTPPRFASLKNNPFDAFLVEKVDKEYRQSSSEKEIMSIVSVIPDFKEALKLRGIDTSLIH